jgi:hypothetical protein
MSVEISTGIVKNKPRQKYLTTITSKFWKEATFIRKN